MLRKGPLFPPFPPNTSLSNLKQRTSLGRVKRTTEESRFTRPTAKKATPALVGGGTAQPAKALACSRVCRGQREGRKGERREAREEREEKKRKRWMDAFFFSSVLSRLACGAAYHSPSETRVRAMFAFCRISLSTVYVRRDIRKRKEEHSHFDKECE